MFVLDIVVRKDKKKKKKLSTLHKLTSYLKIFTHMRVNELFDFGMVSSNYVFTNHTYNMHK